MSELVRTACKIAKQNEDQQIIFGWANVAVNKSGEQLVDWQGDMIDPEELEKAAYEHVLEFRETGERHDPALRSKGRLIESVVFTKEKMAAMGIPEGTVPEGWWVGYKIDDSDTWSKIKKGEYRMFSIDGSGKRTPIEMSDDVQKAVSFDDAILKYNKNHDPKTGRFTSGSGGAASFATVMSGGNKAKPAVNPDLRKQMDKAGIANLGMKQTNDNQAFSDALSEAIKSNPHGGAVDPQSPDDVKDYKKFLSSDNMAGVAVKPDGDITCVFKNSNSSAKGAVQDLILTARENGGTKMDCYGKVLANMYEKCGYEVVAKVAFNADYVSDPVLLQSKPDVYVLKRTNQSTKEVVESIAAGTYKKSSAEDLAKVKAFDKNGYDDALTYRDGLLGSVTKYWKFTKGVAAMDGKERDEVKARLEKLKKQYADNDFAMEFIRDAENDKATSLNDVVTLQWTLSHYA